MKTINFILPATNDTPIGGYKIIYQYANELCNRGYKININFLYKVNPMDEKLFIQKIKRLKRKILHQKMPSEKISWFSLNPKIELFFNVISSNELENADYIFATAAPTAEFVKNLPVKKGKKIYFIQNFEKWWFNDIKDLYHTYNLGLKNIVISKDLQFKVKKITNKTPSIVPNFLNSKDFFPVKKESNQMIVSLLYHIQDSKRSEFGLEVLYEVKKIIPELQINLFGAYKPNKELPNYVNFFYNVKPNELREKVYGTSKVYLLPSILEGWGLTGMEAMACGTALVASDIGGINDYANNNNSILVKPNDKQGFIDSIVYLLKNDKVRDEKEKNALNDLTNFSLENSIKKLEKIISEV